MHIDVDYDIFFVVTIGIDMKNNGQTLRRCLGQAMIEYVVLFVAVAALTLFAVSGIYRDAKSAAGRATSSACGSIAAGR